MQILAKVLEPVSAAGGTAVVLEHLRALLPHGGEVAKSRDGGRAGGLGVHAPSDVVADALLDVKRELIVDFGVWLGWKDSKVAQGPVLCRSSYARLRERCSQDRGRASGVSSRGPPHDHKREGLAV